MAGKILDNGTLITLGLVGVVAAVGAANKAGLYGSRSHMGGETPRSVGNALDEAREDLMRVLQRGPGTIRHESDEDVHDETYSFTNINAAAIRAPGGWTPANYRSSYDNQTGMEDGDYKVIGAAVPSAEAALLIAIQHELHGDVMAGAMARGGFNRKGRKGSRSISPSFASTVARGFDRAARMLDVSPSIARRGGAEYVFFRSTRDGYGTDTLALGATPAPGVIRSSSIVGPKIRDGWKASLYVAGGDDHAVGIYPTASAALIGAMVALVMDTIQNTVNEAGYAESMR
jgi:hypothetical protein